MSGTRIYEFFMAPYLHRARPVSKPRGSNPFLPAFAQRPKRYSPTLRFCLQGRRLCEMVHNEKSCVWLKLKSLTYPLFQLNDNVAQYDTVMLRREFNSRLISKNQLFNNIEHHLLSAFTCINPCKLATFHLYILYECFHAQFLPIYACIYIFNFSTKSRG